MNGEWINDRIAETYAHFGERFSREQCLADLFLLSQQEDRVLNIRGNEVRVKKGQVAISIRTLCKRWSLADKTVQRLLRSFQHENLIKVNGSNTINIIDVFTPITTQSTTQKAAVSDCSTGSYKKGTTQSTTQNDKKRPKNGQNTLCTTQSTTQKAAVSDCSTGSYKKGTTQSATQNDKNETLQKIPRAPAIDSIYNNNQDNNILFDVDDNACADARTYVREEDEGEDPLIAELKNAPIWQEQMCMRHKLSPAELLRWLDTFTLDAECRGTTHRDLSDAKRHFNDWLRIQLREKKRQEDERDRQNQKNRRRGFEVSVGGFEEHATTF